MAHGGILQEVAPLDGATMKVERMFRWSGQALGVVTWISSGLFGIYMLVFYAGSLAAGHAARWNQVLPGLYSESGRVSTAGMGMHFAAGGVILALGFIQLLGAVRARTPALHRWLGRIYVSAGAVAGIGGLSFIAFTGTIGGRVMDVGFGVYGGKRPPSSPSPIAHNPLHYAPHKPGAEQWASKAWDWGCPLGGW